MKNYFSLLFIIIAFLGCSKEDNPNNNNPYLPNYSFNIQLNTNLPAYANLNYISNPVYVDVAGAGVRGLIVMKTGEGLYNAFDAACPNQSLSDCSTMTINGITAVCPCDDKAYNLFTGLASGVKYPMKQYRVSANMNIITISN